MGAVVRIGLGGVNCYLLEAAGGFVLVDTGTPEKRQALEARLTKAGCARGRLQLIVLTHGDYDHAGNAAVLRERYGAPIAMHAGDSPRVERGDWRLGFKPKPDRFSFVFKEVSRLIRVGDFEVFEPDIHLEDGQSLTGFGLDAVVLHVPGHTSGSLGILVGETELVCGDLLDGVGRPSFHFFIDDMAAARDSLERLRRLGVETVYPGHGKPFPLARVRDPRVR
jgi:hydroxyacylglutathione hydrolase